jgi:hypothetical protein
MNTTNVVDIASAVVIELGNREHRDIDPYTAITKVTLLETTKQGKLIQKTTKNGKVYFIYEPVRDFEGKDKATFMVEFAGKRYKVILTLEVSRLVDNNAPLCPETELIKVTKPSSGINGYNLNYVLTSYQPNPSFERDAAKARRPSTLRWASKTKTAWVAFGKCCGVSFRSCAC